MTYSIGFRAPDRRELMGALAELLLSRAGEVRFADPGRALAERPSHIAEADLRQLRELVRGGLALGDDELDSFLCRYLTRPKPNLEVVGEASAVKKVERRLRGGEALVRRPAARFLLAPRASELWLFADGAEHTLELAWLGWLEALIEGAAFDAALLARYSAALPLLCSLLGAGSLEWQADAAGPESSKKE
jgi:ribosomal protein L16 Arg81 hydroxylase